MTVEKLPIQFDRRQHPRFVTAFEAELVEGDEVRIVIVGDISAGGCLLEEGRGFNVGSRVQLRAKGLDIASRVSWVRDDLCGVRFMQMVDPLKVIQDNMTTVPSLTELIAKFSQDRADGARLSR
ncbi:PilZ domain-containing protein [Sphingobium sp.]|uniref:PilZ domain-containing protein n=1 Tax=Sphingobium TaxID=165695 RepID=UPI001A189A4F|nr:PilZ domain-containing protein [Sphingobium sp.]MBJ7375320.1 PilZ domain-containing protein [Sphingobium sp.]